MKTDKEKICNKICGRNCCPPKISNCDGNMTERCYTIQNSFIENLNNNQLEYITSSLEENIFLKACPGSGKTEVLGIKCAYEVKQWIEKYQGIAVLTFTNSAENEIRRRIELFLGEVLDYPHYVGTFTSWIHGYIANPFLSQVTGYIGNENKDKSIKLIESDSNSPFLNAYKSKYKYEVLDRLKAHEYFFDLKINKYIYSGSRSRNGKSILHKLMERDTWRTGDLEKAKKKFWEKGYCLYEDVENLVYELLINKKEIVKLLSKRFPIIFIDECQDLSYVQLKIIGLLQAQGCTVHLIGDLDQSIYGFRRIEPKDTLQFIKSSEYKEIKLNQNYRSCQEIVDASNFIINEKSKVIGCLEKRDSEPLIAILYEQEGEQEVVKKFDELVREYNLKIENSRVIVRNNGLKNRLLGLKNGAKSSNVLEDIAKAIYLSVYGKDLLEFKESFLLFAKSIQKIFFKDSEHLNRNFYYKPIELEMKDWKCIVSEIKKMLIAEKELFDFTKNWKQWKAALQITMSSSVCLLDIISQCSCNLGKIRSGNSDKMVSEILFHNSKIMLDYKIETIHGCKGMSLDAVLFMSAYKENSDKESGAHWRQWFDGRSIEEKNRLAYVAFSRAKYLLALGVPKPKSFAKKDKEMLLSCGFNIIEV